MGDEKGLARTRWDCRYHIEVAPKYRRQACYGEKRGVIGSILLKLYGVKNVRILETESCAGYFHILVEILPKMRVSDFMGYVKEKQSDALRAL